jgi:hypothetical protein
VNAFLNSTYYFLPDSSQTADYKGLLDRTYAEYDNREQLMSDAMDQYLVGYYIEYAAFNTHANDRRSAYVHLCNGATVSAAVLFIFAFLAFYFGELDKSKIKQATEVSITKPIDVRVIQNRK